MTKQNIDLLTFADAIDESSGSTTRHVLLGNGFSIACRPKSFSYGALLDEADFSAGSPYVKDIFSTLDIADFERVIELLQAAAVMAGLYGDAATKARWESDAAVVQEALAQVLAARHPSLPTEIEDHEYQAARHFLAHFKRIYTVSYDMLLYWTSMKDMTPKMARDDGFSNADDVTAEYVVWQPYGEFSDQRVFYLHGGLHLYDKGAELAKITWSRTGLPLVDQIRASLRDSRYPLIVTEGTSQQKLTKILHSAYLNHAIRSFSKIGGTLFVHGHSLAASDDHLLRQIAKGKIRGLYVSLHGDPTSEGNQEIISRALSLAANRPENRPLGVRFYDAASADVWGAM